MFWDEPDLLIISGSHLYGCSKPESDTDFRGFVVEPYEYILGRKTFEQKESKDPDSVVFGLKKFIDLLVSGAPNVIELLFVTENKIIKCSDKGKMLLDNKSLFVSKRIIPRFKGFAISEWRKARAVQLNKESGKEYFSTRKLGERRKLDVENYGYSTKNAYHAIRLLEQGIEILKTGTISFPRPNADFLGNVRDGKVLYRDVEVRYNELEKEIKDLEETSSINSKPDTKAIDDLYYALIQEEMQKFIQMRNLEI